MNELFATVSVWLPGALLMSMLILASAFFSGSETALFYLSREELRRLHSGGSSARQAAKLMRQPDQLLTVVLFWNLVINLSYFSISLVTAKRLVEAGAPTMAGAFSLLSLLVMILFGEVAPKSLAVLFRRTIAVWASWPLSGAVRVLAPILPVLGATTRGLRRAMWPQLKAEHYLELDDIERAIETSELGSELVQLEQKILGRILHLSEMTAEELMRPRGTYEIYQSPITIEDIHNHSRMPAYLLIGGEDRDTISSAIPLDEISSLPERDLEAMAEPVTYVPWCATAAESLSQLRSQLISIAVVINEYGESIGVMTEDDILDTLLDPESSRAKRLLDREPVRRRKDGKIIAEGVTTLRYLSQWLNIDFEPDEDRLLTIVALMHESLERFPEVGDESVWEGLHFRVIKEGGPGEPILVEVAKHIPATDDESNSSY